MNDKMAVYLVSFVKDVLTSFGLELQQEKPKRDMSFPKRPGVGKIGRPIKLRANHFAMNIPDSYLQHYDCTIVPDKLPKRLNRYILFVPEVSIKMSF